VVFALALRLHFVFGFLAPLEGVLFSY